MTRLIAELREKLARQEEVTTLEYGLVIIFLAMAVVAAIPGLAPALAGGFSRIFLRVA